MPYKKILPEELCDDLLISFLSLSDPNSKLIGKAKPRITERISNDTMNNGMGSLEDKLIMTEEEFIEFLHAPINKNSDVDENDDYDEDLRSF